jgi:hypothetical protein
MKGRQFGTAKLRVAGSGCSWLNRNITGTSGHIQPDMIITLLVARSVGPA